MSSSGRAIQPGEPGVKGDPGGIVLGTLLASQNLNAIKTSGVYRQDNGSLPTFLLNYPILAGGTLIVYERVPGASVMQTYYPYQGGASYLDIPRHYIRHMQSADVWGAWRVYTSARVDQTAGRAIYQWDDLNNREQLIYGDTGWRVLELVNGWTGTVHVRRIGLSVKCRILNLDGTAATAQKAFDWPSGFAPDAACLLLFANTTVEPARRVYTDIANGFGLPTGAVYAGSGYSYLTEFVANGSWPASLPGTPSGTIPNV